MEHPPPNTADTPRTSKPATRMFALHTTPPQQPQRYSHVRQRIWRVKGSASGQALEECPRSNGRKRCRITWLPRGNNLLDSLSEQRFGRRRLGPAVGAVGIGAIEGMAGVPVGADDPTTGAAGRVGSAGGTGAG